eukprot:scaffold78442_cov48-Phaeocystis_antarctica.AAC.1
MRNRRVVRRCGEDGVSFQDDGVSSLLSPIGKIGPSFSPILKSQTGGGHQPRWPSFHDETP